MGERAGWFVCLSGRYDGIFLYVSGNYLIEGVRRIMWEMEGVMEEVSFWVVV